MTKEIVLEAVNGLPAEFDLEQLVERLRFMEAVKIGIQEIKEGKTVSQEEVEELIRNRGNH